MSQAYATLKLWHDAIDRLQISVGASNGFKNPATGTIYYLGHAQLMRGGILGGEIYRYDAKFGLREIGDYRIKKDGSATYPEEVAFALRGLSAPPGFVDISSQQIAETLASFDETCAPEGGVVS